MHQQPDGEGDVQAAFGDLRLHFLPGDGRRALAGRAALAQKTTAPRLYHLGTERAKVISQNRQVPRVGWTLQSSRAWESHGWRTCGRCPGLSTLAGADRAGCSL